MYIPNIYKKKKLKLKKIITLNKNNKKYLIKVLRLKLGDKIKIFNKYNQIYLGNIISINKNKLKLKLIKKINKKYESPLNIHLGQIISTDKKMKWIIQKSVELGINTITPLFSKNNLIKINKYKIKNKINKWKKIIISACQQCGRNILPEIKKPIKLKEWVKKKEKNTIKINFYNKTKNKINKIKKTKKNFKILIGSEKGLLIEEIKMLNYYNFINISLGPRILRTETAAIVAITTIQLIFGDLK
ncbi:16S rRNA (uracil(1498)-N(3))-methyltransferase [Candidatus Purcelliella pentastirinorum]|uniref:Ribosomal RNA small subunit methyltransferase E n=1 Tax=Candidatus Purcelliella pentastirinorum TaxID=472834 RepID=A0AAX3N971_9ENTR|nr:16S rRNA (uracil(1498)-N(3))-methyltransferase [Candidatus Purcelliella pentastirinorum]WDI78554.1 16S rRNA (uracil(1498)-N(3))-methyltransferase [Candidatus Purcelliella pentastirinorum]WDR80418.1 16S rRNA (uracil(1498)-N(3))-methyltransferase [Candidatus Purcelliella pentastirinorum]